MKNELKIFENEAFGKVRVIEKNNEPWFVGKDVAEVLGYLSLIHILCGFLKLTCAVMVIRITGRHFLHI